MKAYTFHVNGMHCTACVALTEHELLEDPKVVSAKSNLAAQSVEIVGDFGDLPPSAVAVELTKRLSQHSLALERPMRTVSWREFTIAVPVALGFVALFILLQKLGIVNLVTAGTVTYGTAFVVGIVASLSTCMAVVGGLLLSMSATFAKGGDAVRPQVLFHAGRIATFFVLGGVIGAVGSAFQLGAGGTFAVSLVIGIVMLLLGVNLLDVFPWVKRFQVTLPGALGRRVHRLQGVNHTFTPALVGIATFFLPCGFTQSMQLYTLSTGSFLAGGLTMLAFALGTLPILALVSMSSVSIAKSPHGGVFWKSAGLIVILFALFNILTSLAAAGVIPPLVSF
ncbi:MAG: sulfite exporter TauE/SafE family protein [bacterium]|nr:sulfite exporter TauE/SafE family protein [bacterium]